MTDVITMQSLHKRFGKIHAVRGIDLAIERGSIFGLIGPNGAGKTTVLRMLVDIIRPTSGTITVLDQTPSASRPALRRRIGYLPGELKLTERCSGATLLRHLAEISGPVEPGTVEALAERLDLDLTRPVRTLSKGNRQKLGLIQAFMHRPELLVLDEPTSGLDPLIQREFLALVREAREAGQTVLLSSHILSEIQHTADAAAVLAHGTIVSEGDISSLRLTRVSRLHGLLADTTTAAVRAGVEGLDLLSDLEVESTVGDQIRISGVLRGSPDPLIKALSRFSVRDLTLEEPDLEESILDLYARTGDHT